MLTEFCRVISPKVGECCAAAVLSAAGPIVGKILHMECGEWWSMERRSVASGVS